MWVLWKKDKISERKREEAEKTKKRSSCNKFRFLSQILKAAPEARNAEQTVHKRLSMRRESSGNAPKCRGKGRDSETIDLNETQHQKAGTPAGTEKNIPD